MPTLVKTFRIRKRHVTALVALVFLFLFFMRLIEDRARYTVTAVSQSMVKKVIVVDPGHGGFDTGVIGKSGAMEKDISLELGRRLADNLGQAGAMVLMTREADIDLSDPGTTGLNAKKKEDLHRRVALANDNKADLYLSIHVNSFSSPERRGAQTFVHPGAAQSKKAAQLIQAELAGVLKNTDTQSLEVEHYITKQVSMPAVIVETGFITNETEEKLLQDPNYQSKVAWAIYNGVLKYFTQQDASPHGSAKEDIIKTFKEQEPTGTLRP